MEQHFGYAEETRIYNPWLGFAVSMGGLGHILYEIFSGKAGALAEPADSVCEKVKTSFAAVRFIVSVG